MTAEIHIEPLPAAFERWEELLALITQAFAYMDATIDPPSSAKRLTRSTLIEKANKEQCFIALSGDDLVGCAFADPRGDRLYIGKVAIAEQWRRHGVGKALMAATETYALSIGKPCLELQVRVELTSNHETFKRLGFVETERTSHPGYERLTSITMQKLLSPTG